MRRIEVDNFADAMERQLTANDDKGGWADEENDYLWSKLIEEISELRFEIDQANTSDANILNEAADVANIVMMLADNNTWRTKPLQVGSQ